MRSFFIHLRTRRALRNRVPKKDGVFFREEEEQRKKSDDFMNSKIVQNGVSSDDVLLNSRRDNEKNERTLVYKSARRVLRNRVPKKKTEYFLGKKNDVLQLIVV